LAAQNDGGAADLRRQLEETTSRLAKIEGNRKLLRPSSALMRQALAFCMSPWLSTINRLAGGCAMAGWIAMARRLKDSDGNPVYTTEGRGPEVRGDFFGTGFIVGDGKILTNHHVVQPWWQNEELAGAMKQGLEPVIAEMNRLFSG